MLATCVTALWLLLAGEGKWGVPGSTTKSSLAKFTHQPSSKWRFWCWLEHAHCFLVQVAWTQVLSVIVALIKQKWGGKEDIHHEDRRINMSHGGCMQSRGVGSSGVRLFCRRWLPMKAGTWKRRSGTSYVRQATKGMHRMCLATFR